MDLLGPAHPVVLTPGQQFRQYLWNTAGPLPLLGEAAGAAVSQWADVPPEWEQGWAAYGKRYGSYLAYNAIRQTVTYGISVPLGEDNRYFAAPSKGFWGRTGWALSSAFTARHADGRTTFSVSATAGVVAASALSSIWGPPTWKGPGNIAAVAGWSFASTSAFCVVREFLPDILHKRR